MSLVEKINKLIGRVYIQSCWRCEIEYEFPSAKSLKNFRNSYGNRCLLCEGYLSQVPLRKSVPPPPPSKGLK